MPSRPWVGSTARKRFNGRDLGQTGAKGILVSTTPPPEFVRLRELTRGNGSGTDLTTVLQAIAEDAVEATGFGVCAIQVLGEDQHFELLALAGQDGPPPTERISASRLLRRLAYGERWGMLRYLPQPLVESLDRGNRPPPGPPVAVPTEPVRAHPQAWLPRAELAAPLYSPTDELLGILHFDRPHDGLLPTQTSCELMELCAVQASIAINATTQRARWHEQVWLTGMARSVMDTTAGGFDLDDVLDQALATLRIELGSRAAWLDVFSRPQPGGVEPSRGAEEVTRVTAALRLQRDHFARRSLDTGQPVLLTRDDLLGDPGLLAEPDGGELARAMAADGVHSLALTALPVLDELAGQLVLMRQRLTPWTTAEGAAVQAMGHELGWAIGLDRSRRETAVAAQGHLTVRREEATSAASLARLMSDSLDVVEDHLDRTGVPPGAPARTAIDRLWEVLRQRLTLSSFEHPDRVVQASRFDAGQLLTTHWHRLRGLAGPRGVRLLPLDLSAGRSPVPPLDGPLDGLPDGPSDDPRDSPVEEDADPQGELDERTRRREKRRAQLKAERWAERWTSHGEDPDDTDGYDRHWAAPGAGNARVTAWADAAVVDWLLEVVLGELVREASSGATLGLSVAAVPGRLLISCLISPPVEPGPALTSRLDDTRWWTAGATRLLAQHGGQLNTRMGNDGRRVVSIGLATRPLSDAR